MAQDEVNAIRQAISAWQGGLLGHPATQGMLNSGKSSTTEDRTVAVAAAAQQLASCLEDKRLPEGLINDLLNVCGVFTSLCGVSMPHPSPAPNPDPLRAAKLQMLRAATGLPVHTTSIGRRASASYCVYESMGGWETLSAAVEGLYNRMRADPRCAALTADTANEQNLKTHTLEFLTCALGGKARLASSTLLTNERDQLRSHGFGAGQFDVLLQHMKAVLDDLGVQKEIAASAIALLRCHNRYLFDKRTEEDDTTPPPSDD